MKKITVLVISLSVFLFGCVPQRTSPTPSVPEISTTLPEPSITPTLESNNMPPGVQSTSADSITLGDNGKTFHYHVGDSFLLNLGSDVYDWNVSIDNQDVVALRVGVMVIRGAQGLYDMLNPGTATLTAVGDPLCRQSSPPCGMPTILFKVTLVVN